MRSSCILIQLIMTPFITHYMPSKHTFPPSTHLLFLVIISFCFEAPTSFILYNFSHE